MATASGGGAAHDTRARVDEDRFQGEPALTLSSGALTATFLPAVGMTGVSLRYRGVEHLAVPGGVAALRAGATGGLPLLAPWANRLSQRRYRASRVDVDLSGLPIPTDGNGLPIHGLLVGKPGWRIDQRRTRGELASLHASIDVDAPAFPFPHRIEVAVTALDNRLDVTTTITPAGRRRVPVAFGWHPYLQLPGAPRRRWTLRLPRRHHLELDDRGIPTGRGTNENAEAAEIERRTFDDLYELGRERRLAVTSPESAIELHCGAGYECAQVWIPPRRRFVALEPMVTRTNALVDGTTPLVRRGDQYRARFSLVAGDT